jgi:glycosyltransferase involved in cell wall biosynthesis
MNRPLKRVLLVGNYPADRLQSMLRFGTAMEGALSELGIACELIAPQLKCGEWFGRYRYSGWQKWLGYVDKHVIFPRRLRDVARALPSDGGLVHVVDHGNAMYVPQRRRHPWLVTCHDLLTVRAARGEDTTIQPSFAGQVQQNWIVRGLARCDHVVCDSEFTRRDFGRLVSGVPRARVSVIPISLNHPYRRIAPGEARARIEAAGGGMILKRPFLLHVGSNLARKNRAGVLRVAARLRERHDVAVIFAGQAPDEPLQKLIGELGLAAHVHGLADIANDVLEALYNAAHALVFPSHFEGFGWPVAEAQACECPVVCSNTSSIPEVAGGGALLHEVQDEAGMADSLSRLFEPEFRTQMLARGRSNVARFTPAVMARNYADVYRAVLQETAHGYA